MKVLACLVAAIVAFPAAAKFGDVLKDGPVEGMAIGATVKSGQGYYLAALLPSIANTSPVSDARASATAEWVAAAQSGKWAGVSEYTTAGATSVWCPLATAPNCDAARPVSSFKLPAQMRANAPYLMKNGQVRIEWLDGDGMKFASWLTFEGNEISSVMTRSTDVPIPIMVAPGAVQ